MEITFDSIINLFGLFIGGGSIVSLVTWKIARRKAVAEAKQAEAVATQAEAEAKKAEAEALQEKQNLSTHVWLQWQWMKQKHYALHQS